MEEKDHIQEVAGWVLRELQGDESRELKQELSRFVAASEENARLYARLKNQDFLATRLQEYRAYEESKERNWERLQEYVSAGKRKTARTFYLPRVWWAAASIMLLLGAGFYFWRSRQIPASSQQIAHVTDVPAGQAGAILTLSDGRQVSLDTITNGVIALQSGVTAKVVNGNLYYEGNGTKIAYNIMNTPRGRQYQLTLPDGTQAWLNSFSSIRYPTVFTGNKREVEITGEVYLEVAKDAQAPFYVNVKNKAKVQVLGTSFNINAYEDNSEIYTTLLEGSVRISKDNAAVNLHPGQQAILREAPQPINVLDNVEIDKVLAWKNGAFNFEDVTLAEAMKQLERWYDIEVVIEKDVPANLPFYGKISRTLSLQKLLDALDQTDLKFRIEQHRKLIITK
ncbi:FecR domain-containing protein [Chitinophaga eiseniae]|uniref:DUF4974 domain-containing protein n=1 Tax=Chitinophaga eiseniae TaxID=634771 RepID=A0A847SJY4_9BACT|nr:FecR domain-containing protein [Chitinophaga eiseniae]NLR79087.1 DUF4974 domain-containing protein [Chitinophaga eiseniae]